MLNICRTWNADEFRRDFRRTMLADFPGQRVGVVRKVDGVAGSLEYTGSPRIYYGFARRAGR